MAATESLAAACIQENDNGEIQFCSDCLSTPVILRIIMEHLSNTDLLEVSFVNKLWNYEARSVLKNRCSLIARIESKSPCQKVAGFASDVRQMNVVPFAGINIKLEDWKGCEGCEASPSGSLDPNSNIILDRVSWKHLRFDWGKNWQEAKKCQAFLLAQKILENFSGELEELQLHLEGRTQEFMQQMLDCEFPKLKTLDLRTNEPDENRKSMTKALVSRAPQLQEFHEHWWVNLKENFLEGSSAVLVTHRPVRPAYDEIFEGTLPALRLANMVLEVQEQDFSLERFNRITPLLLENSKTTLTNLRMDALFALPLMCYGIRLENVQVLEFRMDYRHLENFHPRVLTILKAFDFSRIFPNLYYVEKETIENHMALEKVNEIIAQANPLLKEPMPDRAANIKQLHLSQHVQDCAIPFLAQMFANTKNLWIYRELGQEIPYGLIWEHFKGLEELNAHKHGDYYQNVWPKNLDSVFCGIFSEEAAELREKDEEYLKSVHIVPVMPAITCLTGLKSIDVAIWDEDYDDGVSDEPRGLGPPPPRDYGPTFLFSRVTGLIAFARMPSLSVSMHSDIPELEIAMSHLKPYARVYLED